MINKIEVVVLEKVNKEGRKFKAYSAYRNGKYLCGLKFVLGCVPPKESGIIEVDDENLFLSKTKPEYVTYCVKDYRNYTPTNIEIKPRETPFEKI